MLVIIFNTVTIVKVDSKIVAVIDLPMFYHVPRHALTILIIPANNIDGVSEFLI